MTREEARALITRAIDEHENAVITRTALLIVVEETIDTLWKRAAEAGYQVGREDAEADMDDEIIFEADLDDFDIEAMEDDDDRI